MVITTVIQAFQLKSQEHEPWICPATITAACTEVEHEWTTSTVVEIVTENLKKVQEDDPVIGKVREYVMTRQRPQLRGNDQHDDTSVLGRERNRLYVNKDGILYRKSVT